ncbi:MAG: hypothetical protein ACRD21_21755 [Vicinamibacteria bacterium]
MRFLTLALLWVGSAEAADGPSAAAAFGRLKGLVGEWEGIQPNGEKATTRYELMGNGSALVEYYAGMGAGNEMLTVYHLDGDRLLLTHYCMAKNQPRLQLSKFDAATGELAFDFLDVTGLADPSAGHMRTAWFQFESADRFTTKWQYFENGKISFDEKQQFTRVK